ncbi:MAG: Fe-S cluster assembly protein SufD [Gammaproteobacteria bacterium]|nr:Fe-S cluster assembly protein SufD [Gammaproteobacteria bacterium]
MSSALQSFEAALRARPPDRLAAMRAESMRRFLELGLPNTGDETWRYTNLRGLAAKPYVDAPRIAAGAAVDAAASWLAAASTAAPVRIVNGFAELGDGAPPERPGVTVRSLRSLAAQDPEWLLERIAPAADTDEERWALLNRALFVDGIYLRIDSPVEDPILIVHLALPGGADTAVHSRVIIETAPGATATIIEHHIGSNGAAVLANSATQIELAADSSVEHYRVFAGNDTMTHIDALTVRQARGSRCRQFTIALGGALVRADLRAKLDGPGAAHDSHSLLVGHGSRHVDCVATVLHASPQATSTQTSRAIASGTGRVVFNSKVVVAAGAAGTQSNQSARGLLLSPTAEIDTRPQLEIHADDVKCAHGATTGRLDPDMMFYLLSRGIDRAAAQSLLIYAFLDDVLTGMSSPAARSAIENALIAELPDADLLREFR